MLLLRENIVNAQNIISHYKSISYDFCYPATIVKKPLVASPIRIIFISLIHNKMVINKCG